MTKGLRYKHRSYPRCEDCGKADLGCDSHPWGERRPCRRHGSGGHPVAVPGFPVRRLRVRVAARYPRSHYPQHLRSQT